MFKRILVAVDGSSMANEALQAAIGLAKAPQSQLRIVYVVDEATLNWPEGGNLPEFQEAFRNAGRAILEQAAAAARTAGVSAETRLLEIETLGHRLADRLAAEAEAWPADVIALGTHGRRGLSRLFLGSVAEGVARVATKPVLLIRGK